MRLEPGTGIKMAGSCPDRPRKGTRHPHQLRVFLYRAYESASAGEQRNEQHRQHDQWPYFKAPTVYLSLAPTSSVTISCINGAPFHVFGRQRPHHWHQQAHFGHTPAARIALSASAVDLVTSPRSNGGIISISGTPLSHLPAGRAAQ